MFLPYIANKYASLTLVTQMNIFARGLCPAMSLTTIFYGEQIRLCFLRSARRHRQKISDLRADISAKYSWILHLSSPIKCLGNNSQHYYYDKVPDCFLRI